jgi:hypothetical protein
MHLIDKHLYPRNFFFAITRDGIDGRQSLLVAGRHERRVSTASKQPLRGPSQDPSPGTAGDDSSASSVKRKAAHDGLTDRPPLAVEEAQEDEMTDLTGAMSALHCVPSSVKFGRRKSARSGFARS